MGKRQCPYCGKYISDALTQCPLCREALDAVPHVAGTGAEQGQRFIRRGVLYMVMAGVIHFLLGEYIPLQIPFEVPSFVGNYLVPFLFLGGLGLTAFGVIRRLTS